MLFVKKPGSGVRVCIDYKGINNIIFKSQYLFPLIKEIFDIIYYIKIFIKFNIIITFNYIRIKFGYEWLIVFIIRFGLFEFFVVPFGL